MTCDETNTNDMSILFPVKRGEPAGGDSYMLISWSNTPRQCLAVRGDPSISAWSLTFGPEGSFAISIIICGGRGLAAWR